MPVQAGRAEAVVDDERDRGRHHAPAGDVAVQPVPDRGELRGPAHDVVDGDLTREPAVDVDRERHRHALPGMALHPGHQAPERRRPLGAARWHGRVPRLEPDRVAPAYGAPGAGVAVAQRPQGDVAVVQRRRASPCSPCGLRARQWSLPTICSTAWTSRGSRTAIASFTPPARPGQVHHQAVAGDPGEPARQGGGRDALGDAVGTDGLGDAGHLPVEQGTGDLGGAVGRGEARAAGRQDHPRATADLRRDGGADRVAVGYDGRPVAPEPQ